jgi:hypothetical protein
MTRLFAERAAGSASPVEIEKTRRAVVRGTTEEHGPFRFTERGGVVFRGIEHALSPDLVLPAGDYELSVEGEWFHVQHLATHEVRCFRMRDDGRWEELDHTPMMPSLPTALDEQATSPPAPYRSVWEQVLPNYPIGDAVVSYDYIKVGELAFATSKPFDHTDPRTCIRYRLRLIEGFTLFTVTGGTLRADFYLEGEILWRGYKAERTPTFLEKPTSEMTPAEKRLAAVAWFLQKYGGPNVTFSIAVVFAALFMLPSLVALVALGRDATPAVVFCGFVAIIALLIVKYVTRSFPRIPPD